MAFTPIPAGTLHWDVPVNAAFVDQDNRITSNAANISSTTTTANNAVVKGSLVVNVKDFGATGDGIANDTSAIQDAISSLSSTGGVVYLPVGVYKLTAALTLTNGITLQGVGQGVSVLSQSNVSSNGISGTDLSRVSLSSLTITGPTTGTGTGVVFGLSANQATTFINFTDVTISLFGVDGLNINTPIVSSFSGVQCVTNARHGFNINSASSTTSCTFNNCYANNNGQIGYNITKMFYSFFGGCAADSNGLGYLFTASSAVTLSSCGAEATVVKNGQDGTGFKIVSCEGVSLIGCSVSNNSAVGIWLNTAGDAHVLQACVEQSVSGSPTAFIKVDAAASCTLCGHASITANSFSGSVTQIHESGGQMNLPGFLFVGTSLEVTSNIICDTGNISTNQAGKTFIVKNGTNAKAGTATLVAGTVTVSTTAVTTNSTIAVSMKTAGGTPGALFINPITPGTNFTIKSTSATDTSVVNWIIFEQG